MDNECEVVNSPIKLHEEIIIFAKFDLVANNLLGKIFIYFIIKYIP